jgi:hypothetical protein
MSETKNDIASDVWAALKERLPTVYELIRDLRDHFQLVPETRPVSRQIFGSLSLLWVALQESNSKHLQGYGRVDPLDAQILDPVIESLAGWMLDLEQIVVRQGLRDTSVDEKERLREHRLTG